MAETKITFDEIADDYSANEVNTWRRWIDGTYIYKKTVDVGTLPNNTIKQIPHGITSLGRIISASGAAQPADKSQIIPLPYTNGGNINYGVSLALDASNITLEAKYDRSGMTGFVTVYYTKLGG